MAQESTKGSVRLKFAWFALFVAVFVPLWFIAAAVGSKLGLWPWQFGLGKMTFAWGLYVIAAGVIVAFVSLILAVIKAPRKQPLILSILALFLVSWSGGNFFNKIMQAKILPPIHDVQTDWADPVHFSDALMAQRAETPNVNAVEDDPVIPQGADARWPGMGGRHVAEVQVEKYEPLQTKIYAVTPDKLYTAAFLVMTGMQIEPVTQDETNFVLEGTYTSRWFGFKDDVAVRIRPKGESGSEMDVRSVSRVGLSDLGANIERVHSFIEGVDEKVGQLTDE